MYKIHQVLRTSTPTTLKSGKSLPADVRVVVLKMLEDNQTIRVKIEDPMHDDVRSERLELPISSVYKTKRGRPTRELTQTR